MKRVALVTAMAAAAFSVSIIRLNGSGFVASCLPDARRDPTFTAQFVNPISMDQATLVLAVQRYGEPLVGARVCVYTSKVGRSGLALSDSATVVGPGRYAVRMQFSMGGQWQALISIRLVRGSAVLVCEDVNVSEGSAAGIP